MRHSTQDVRNRALGILKIAEEVQERKVVTKDELAEVGRVIQEVNRHYNKLFGMRVDPPWSELEEDDKNRRVELLSELVPNIKTVSAQKMHDMWMAEKKRGGWKYGNKYDFEKKTHPCIVPWDDLPDLEKAKDAMYIAVVKAMVEMKFGIDKTVDDKIKEVKIPGGEKILMNKSAGVANVAKKVGYGAAIGGAGLAGVAAGALTAPVTMLTGAMAGIGPGAVAGRLTAPGEVKAIRKETKALNKDHAREFGEKDILEKAMLPAYLTVEKAMSTNPNLTVGEAEDIFFNAVERKLPPPRIEKRASIGKAFKGGFIGAHTVAALAGAGSAASMGFKSERDPEAAVARRNTAQSKLDFARGIRDGSISDLKPYVAARIPKENYSPALVIPDATIYAEEFEFPDDPDNVRDMKVSDYMKFIKSNMTELDF